MSSRAATLCLALVTGAAALAGCESTPAKHDPKAEGAARSDRTASAPPAPSSGARSPSVAPPAVATRYATKERIVAIGDLHGDLGATRAALRLARVLDEQDRWSGGKTFAVQTGDVLDRGDDEQAILDLLERLATEAERAGGRLLTLNGNHELMNAAGDFRYVTPRGLVDFDDAHDEGGSPPGLERFPSEARLRARALLPGGSYARRLANHPVVAIVEDTVFAHGGVLPQYAGEVEAMNQEVAAWLAGHSPKGARVVALDDGPVWSRHFSSDTDAADCEKLGETLKLLGAKRMVVGHSVQKTINSACDERVWRIDVGMAKAYGGRPAVLEIEGGAVRVIRAE